MKSQAGPPAGGPAPVADRGPPPRPSRRQHAEDHKGQHHRRVDRPRRAGESPLQQLAHAGELLADQVGHHDPEEDRVGQEITPAEGGRGHSLLVGQSGHAQQRLQAQPGGRKRDGHGIPGELAAGEEVIVGDIEFSPGGGQPDQHRRGQQQDDYRQKDAVPMKGYHNRQIRKVEDATNKTRRRDAEAQGEGMWDPEVHTEPSSNPLLSASLRLCASFFLLHYSM